MTRDELYMQRAFELAELGRGNVSPNPLVGCVIVKGDKIIGEGWHQKFGGPHAEVNAIDSVKDKELLRGAELYINLEPCSHFGKTPPCVDLISKYPFARIVFSNIDPNPLVAGTGFEKLMTAGFVVEQGVLEDKGRELNKRFFTFMEKGRPFVILKWAETADGFIAKENYESKWISNDLSRRLVHKWRSEEDAVMVGTNTALYDNPQLNVRDWSGRNPTRVVIDKNLQIPAGSHLLDGTQTTICYNFQIDEVKNLVEFVKVDPVDDLVNVIVRDLFQRKLQSVMIEGGSKLLNGFIQKGLWDEARVFYSDGVYRKGITAPVIKGKVISREYILNDELVIYRHF